MAAPAFSPRWMYGPNREAVEVHTQEHMDQVVKDGWKKSPAEFGIETHPQHPVQTIGGMVAVPGDTLSPSPQMAKLETATAELQAAVESLTQRLSALETASARSPSVAPSSASTEESESQSGRRRS